MALFIAVFAAIAPRIEARAGAHRTVAAGLLVTIGLMAAGVAVSYLTLRPRGRAVSSEPTVAGAELATVDELEAELMR
jgi:hypothetical protein